MDVQKIPDNAVIVLGRSQAKASNTLNIMYELNSLFSAIRADLDNPETVLIDGLAAAGERLCLSTADDLAKLRDDVGALLESVEK